VLSSSRHGPAAAYNQEAAWKKSMAGPNPRKWRFLSAVVVLGKEMDMLGLAHLCVAWPRCGAGLREDDQKVDGCSYLSH
jgi:hypothetical protein